MAAAFYGRNRAYGEALAARDAEALAAALARNVYGASDVSAAPRSRDLAAYVLAAAARARARGDRLFSPAAGFVFPGALGDAR